VSDLVRELELLGAELQWPPTPAFAPRAAAAAAPVRRGRGRSRRRRLVLAIVLGVLALAAGALAATGVIHFGGATIQRVDRLPPVDPAPTLALGRPIRLGEAHGILPFTLPPRLTDPDAVYTRDNTINLLYLDAGRPRAVLTVFREDSRVMFDKLVHTTSKIRRVRVRGAPGLYIPDAHVVDFLYGGDPRLSEPTLLWVSGGVTYRLEARDALALASSG
jgi:hypothetical protein